MLTVWWWSGDQEEGGQTLTVDVGEIFTEFQIVSLRLMRLAADRQTGPLSLVQDQRGSALIGPAILCHKEPARASKVKVPCRGLWIRWACSLWHKTAGVGTPRNSSWHLSGPHCDCDRSLYPLDGLELELSPMEIKTVVATVSWR